MSGVLVGSTVFLGETGEVLSEGGKVWKKGGSRHVLAYASGKGAGKCVFVDSQGTFDETAFAKAVEVGQAQCAIEKDEDVAMEGAIETVGGVVRKAIEKKVEVDMRWKD